METKELQTWSELNDWLDDTRWLQEQNGKQRFAFRGQAETKWSLQTSLAYHFGTYANGGMQLIAPGFLECT